MQAEIAPAFSRIRDALVWTPDWLASILLIALAALVAFAAHAIIFLVVRRTAARFSFLRAFTERGSGPLLLALLIFAATAALQAAPLAPGLIASLTHLLLVAFVVLLGWIAMIAVELAADLYLRRFRTDVADNLLARKHTTQVRILKRTAEIAIVIFTISGVLMTFEAVRQYGISIFASAGIAGIVAGLAARPVLSNLFAGIQIAVAQPIRLDDTVVVEGESGRIEEITATYVVVRLWDLRRLVVPLSYFIEKPFENWTRETAALFAPVILYLDYTAPIGALREKLDELVKDHPLWDRAVKNLQVTGARPDTIEVRVLLSAANSSDAFNLRCDVREKLIAFLQAEHPNALPRQRSEIVAPATAAGAETAPQAKAG